MKNLKNLIYYKEHDEVINNWPLDTNLILESPTGSGKTVIMLRMIDKSFELGNKYLLVCPTNLLIKQVYDSFCNFSNYNVKIITEAVKEVSPQDIIDNDIFITTGHKAALLYSKKIWFENTFTGVFMDEVHKIKQINKNPYWVIASSACKSFLVGCTATLPAKIKKQVFAVFGEETLVLKGQAITSWKKTILFEPVEFSAYKKNVAQKSRVDLLKYASFFKTRNNLDLSEIMDAPNRLFLTKKPKGALDKSFALDLLIIKRIFLRYNYLYESYDTYMEYLKKSTKSPISFWALLSRFIPLENEKFKRIFDLIKHTGTAIIFLENYNTLLSLKEYLKNKTKDPIFVLGGKSKISQKERSKSLKDIKKGFKSIILTTSVAEEGLDIGYADKVIFYKPVVKQTSYLQRIGRTGRHKDGSVSILYYKDTREEKSLPFMRKLLKKCPGVQEYIPEV